MATAPAAGLLFLGTSGAGDRLAAFASVWEPSFLWKPDTQNGTWVPIKTRDRDFPGGAVVKNPPANAGDTGLSPGLGRSHMPRSN